MVPENRGILPEQNGIPRREPERQYVATFQQPEMQGNMVQDLTMAADHGSRKGACLAGYRQFVQFPAGTC